MNAKLKQFAKLRKQLQLLDNSSASYKKICSDASKFRVQKYKDVQDTRKIGFSKSEIDMAFAIRN